LPAPNALDVQGYATYIAAFKAIQKQVFSDVENQVPVLLEIKPVRGGTSANAGEPSSG
jgi:hypothetical protein